MKRDAAYWRQTVAMIFVAAGIIAFFLISQWNASTS